MSIKQIRNKIMEYIINGNNDHLNTSPNKITLETYKNKYNNIEKNYLPFIDVNYNKNATSKAIQEPKIYFTSNIPNDNLTKTYIVGLSLLGLYMLNSIILKQNK